MRKSRSILYSARSMSLGRLVLPVLAAALLMLSGGVADASLGAGLPRSTSVAPTSSSSSAGSSAVGRQVRRAVSPAASPTSYSTITFSEVPLEEFVTNQYEDDGVIFTSTVQTAEDEANPTSPVLSGYPRFEGAIEGYFVDPSTGLPQAVRASRWTSATSTTATRSSSKLSTAPAMRCNRCSQRAMASTR